ncbi:GGDEF domain-containing protein [Oceanospirillum sediminis]|uniref:diguanylate cyclase n=1 Tax=Oceanospirillum sediminis TaxID=2760088 RepID=A0A839ILU1_9GAMM|nr:GGDEF domain-containing protein [Oceanospirillum sediminis]
MKENSDMENSLLCHDRVVSLSRCADKNDADLLPNTGYRKESSEAACLNMMRCLSTTLSPESVLVQFELEMKRHFPICNVSFRNSKHILTNQRGVPGIFSMEIELIDDEHIYGCLMLEFEWVLSPVKKRLVNQLTQMLTFPLKNAVAFQEMKQLALTDSLTGLPNRNSFENAFQQLMARYQSKGIGKRFSLLILDLDDFKRINDKHGHQTGDLVLSCFADVLRSCCNKTAEAFRFGGDEFTVLVHAEGEDLPHLLSSRIRLAVANNSSLVQYGINCSIGYSSYQPGDSLYSLFERADNALLQIREGR